MKLFTIAQVHQVEFFTQISRQQDGWAWTQANVAERDGRNNVHDGCCYQAITRFDRMVSEIEIFRQQVRPMPQGVKA